MPNAIAEALRSRGIDVLTAAEAGMLGKPDADLLERSFTEGRVVVTQDRDFPRLHHARQRHAGIAYSQRGTRTIGEIIEALLLIHDVLDSADMIGKIEFI